MTFALLVALATCAAVWFLTGPSRQRGIGMFFGFVDYILWLCAGVNAGKIAVVIVAGFSLLCFLRPTLRHLFQGLRRQHAH
jgi:hypothetical protein